MVSILCLVVAGVILVGMAPAMRLAQRWLDKRKPRPPPPPYKLVPLTPYGDLFTLAKYRELLKIYSMDSDNGMGYWATAEGLWVDTKTDRWISVNPYAIRQGAEPPEPFFTHVMYHMK